VIQASTQAPNGRWSPPVALSAVLQAASVNARIDGRGRLVVVWRGFGAHSVMGSAVRAVNGRWRVLAPIAASGAAEPGSAPRLWPLRDGGIETAWISPGGPHTPARAFTARLAAEAGAWSRARPLSMPERDLSPWAVAIAPDGGVRAVAARMRGSRVSLTVASRSAAGRWGRMRPLGTVGPFDTPSIVIGSSGSGVAVFSRTPQSYGASSLLASTLAADGSAAQPVSLAERAAPPGGHPKTDATAIEAIPWFFDAVEDDAGGATVAWSEPRVSPTLPELLTRRLLVAGYEPAGGWSRPEQLVAFPQETRIVAPHLIPLPDHRVLAYWAVASEQGMSLQASEGP